MNIIKFSHKYVKMLQNEDVKTPSTAQLIGVFKTTKQELSKEFIEYDTKYFDNQSPTQYSYYPLPDGELFVLFLKSGTMMWTTVRRFTPQKYGYYINNCGKTFEVKIC